MVGQTTQTTQRYGVKITTVDPTQRLVEGTTKASLIRISVIAVPVAFRWPIVGEHWIARQENGTWYLDGPKPSLTAPITFEAVAPGDAIIDSPTGIVHVMGSDDGSTDFDITDAHLWQSGDLKMSAAIATPDGWLICDGSAVSRITYADLFDAIGTSQGPGDGSTTFNIPDYRGRTILGAGTGPGLTTRNLGDKGGTENHIHHVGTQTTSSTVPTHSHTLGTAGGAQINFGARNGSFIFTLARGADTAASVYAPTRTEGVATGLEGPTDTPLPPIQTGVALYGATNAVGAATAPGSTSGGDSNAASTSPMTPYATANVFIKI